MTELPLGETGNFETTPWATVSLKAAPNVLPRGLAVYN